MNNLSALLIGPTDKTKIFRHGKISKDEYSDYRDKIASVLAEHISNLGIIPDEGMPLDFAKSYKNFGGKKVVGYIPKGGCESLNCFYKFCDNIEEIDGGWTVLNTCLSLKHNIMIGFGLSPGTIVEIAYTKYHNKYLNRRIPIFLDRNLIESRLNPEIEEELALSYFSSSEELGKLLQEIKKK